VKRLPIDELLDILLDMPDIEARQEIDLRKDHLALELSMLQCERAKADKKSKLWADIGAAMMVTAKDLARLNIRRKEINERMDRTSWAKAVTAIYGQEGFEACREWMAMHTDTRAA
jgi:hypothetical protein